MSVQNIIAVIFDCDDTLCEDTITYLLTSCGINAKSFWDEVADEVQAGADPPLAYMYKITELVKSGEMPGLNNAKLREIGSQLKFFPGIPEVFEELLKFVNDRPKFVDAGVCLEFYIVTGGFEEMVKGSQVEKYMTDIFGCTFDEDPETGLLYRPKSVVTFTEKTKFIYAINKGISSAELRRDPYRVNDSVEEKDRRVPFSNMIYIGDGPSDIPCFSLIKQLGAGNGSIGHVIGVYKRGRSRRGYELARGRRITVGPFSANYISDSDLRKCLEDNIFDIGLEIVRKRKITFRPSVRHA
jgi:phosphoglycolate phosphatase-like HAD superfamily hydrolase